MLRRVLSLGLTLGLLALASGAAAQGAATDPEVLKGITQAEQGDYDAAIFTLDTAARRLAGDATKTSDLSQAYLYLGIAYFGKGHEAAAKAKFKEAIRQFRDISLSAEQYPPKIIDLFESAREEAGAPAPAPSPAVQPQEKKKGSKMPLILIGVGGAAAAGVAVAAGGGGGDEGSDLRTENFTGTVELAEWCRHYTISVQASGIFEANLTWQQPDVQLGMELWNNPDWQGEAVMRSNRTSNNSASLRYNANPAIHILEVCHWDSPCVAQSEQTGSPCAATYELTVRHP